jgi:hypothetical protein
MELTVRYYSQEGHNHELSHPSVTQISRTYLIWKLTTLSIFVGSKYIYIYSGKQSSLQEMSTQFLVLIRQICGRDNAFVSDWTTGCMAERSWFDFRLG